MIEANPPSEVVALLQEELADMEDDPAERYSETRDAPQQFEVTESRATVHKRIAEITADAEEVVLSIPAPVVPKVRDDLADTVERGVLVLVLVTGVDGDADDEYDGSGNVVRTWAEKAPVLLAADQRVGVFAPDELLAKAHSARQALVLTQDQPVPTLIGSFFGNYWQVAEEASVDPPRDLPTTYRTFRHAVRGAPSPRRHAGRRGVRDARGRGRERAHRRRPAGARRTDEQRLPRREHARPRTRRRAVHGRR